LFFVIFDEKNDVEDLKIARHIINMHRMKDDRTNSKFTKE
jgi:DNA replicative helicase MCM subunit Mcm2 (Cdc46/Mcm family)